MVYLILANISLILFFGIYLLVLKRLTFFQWNRGYLLSAVMISFTLPLLQYVDLSQHREVYQPLTAMDFVEVSAAAPTEQAVHDNSWLFIDWIRLIYGIGAALMLLWLGIRLYRVCTLLRTGSAGLQSFSFFNRVFIAEESRHCDMVATHEQIHMRQGHSYDILFMEIVRAFNWFNPIFHFYLKELKFQHECIADKGCAADRVQYAELLVANAMGASPNALVHEFSNQSLLKRRIMMLFKSKSKKINRIKYLMLLPVALLIATVALVFNSSIKAAVENQIQHFENMDTSFTGKTDWKSPEPEIGRKAFMEWFVENYEVPGAVNPNDKDPFIDVRFNVSETGELSDFQLGEGSRFGKAFFDEAVRLISQSKWKPAIKNGEPIAHKGWVGFKFDAAGNLIKNYTRVDVSPEPKGGLVAWKEYIGKWYKFPQELAEQKGSGEVLVSFIVDKSGEIRDMKTLKEPIPGAGKAAQDAIAKFGSWKPGILDGEGAAYVYQLPVTLKAPDGYGVIEIGGLTTERIKE